MLKIKTKRKANGDIKVASTYEGGSSADVMAELSAIIVDVIERLVEEHHRLGQNVVTEKFYFEQLKGFLDWYLDKKEGGFVEEDN